jgi:phosphonate transport system ATP-binding protein
VNLAVDPGERVALIGPSGAGKSTLLRLINGLITPAEGEVRALGETVSTMPESAKMRLRRRIGMVFQEFALVERLPVLTNVLVGRLGHSKTLPSLLRLFPREDLERALSAIRDVGLAGYEERLVRNLSGGQKQRVGIARALVQESPLLLGDEPTANLDLRTADEILALLVDLADQRSATLILTLHDVHLARKRCTRIAALRDGSITWDGPAHSFSDSDVERVFYNP